MHLAYLADHPQHVPLLARWHYGAWGAILRGWSERAAAEELATHRARRAIPTTVIALDGDTPIGSASLLANDHDRIRAYSPWLASVFVAPEQRRRGVGRALVERVVDEAAALEVPTLYLYTDDASEWYHSLGWRMHERVELDGLAVWVMALTPRAASEARVPEAGA